MTSTINASLSAGIVTTADTSGVLALQTAGTTAVTVDASQNVGIGTASPTSKLSVAGAISSTLSITASTGVVGITTTSGAYGLRAAADSANTYASIQFTNFAQNSALAYIRSYASNKVSILDSAGSSSVNVGIGTTAPDASYSLDTTGTIRSRANIYAGFVSGSQAGIWLTRNDYSSPAIQGLTSAGNAGTLLVNPGGGTVTIGANSGNVRNINLNSSEISIAQATTNAYLNLSDANGSNGNTYNFLIRGLGSSGTAQNTLTSFSAIATSCYNGVNSTVWQTTSDQRLKKNIVDNNEGLEKIAGIRVRNFEYRTADEITDFPEEENIAINVQGVQLGVIAQELREVLPDCVYEQKNGVLSMSADNLMWHMVNAIKELNTKVTQLQADVAALKGATP